MNRIFRLVWNFSRPAALLLGGLAFSGYLSAGPTGGQVTSGSGHVTQSGSTTTIQQTTPTLGLDWQSFNVAANETVNFVQPSSSAIAVNRILSSSGSEILGHLNANGQIWLINPNGILFGSDAQVDVAGLVASTLEPSGTGFPQSESSQNESMQATSLQTASFMGGGTNGSGTGGGGAGGGGTSGSGAGGIVNQGTLTAAKGGYVALLGNSVSNEGVVSAQLGTVALGAGSAATLTFSGNKLLQLQVDQGVLGDLAANRGLIVADGGTVYMTAGAQNSLLASSVNTSGVIRASSMENHDGTIVLSAGLPAGEVTIGGLLDASASRGVGGEVTATAGEVTVGAGATVNASGGAGGGAIRIGGGWEGGEGVPQATTVSVADTATLDASATKRGNGGEIVVRSDVANSNSTTRVYGTLLAEGGPEGGDGGRIETSGHWLDVTGITVDSAASAGAAGLWLLDPYNVTIGSTGSSVSSGGGTFTPTYSGDTITASSIATALENGNNVTISTYNIYGTDIGDITVSSPINKAGGNTNVTLTLQAADTIAVNAPISNTGGTGQLNVTLLADNDGATTNGTHDGVGVIILNNSITTGGGAINFGNGATITVNGVANTLVGGDVYVGNSSGAAVNLTTAGGNVSIYGQLIIANNYGLNIDTTNGGSTAGNVLFDSTIDSGDTYALNQSYGNVDWAQAVVYAKSGDGSHNGDTYLATITSRLENAVASYDVNYTQSWLGAERVFGLNTDAVWRWVTGPEGLTNNGEGLPFFTENGCDTSNCNPNQTVGVFNGGTAINGAYTNWNPTTAGGGEPNNDHGTSLNQAGSGEWALQFVGTQGQWNDLNPNDQYGNTLPFTVETNLAPSSLTVNAGATGSVTFNGAIGANKPLFNINITGQPVVLPPNPTVNTTGTFTINGVVQIDNVEYQPLVITAPNVTTTYRATLGALTPTYSGFVNGDTVNSLTTLPTVTTTGSTNYVSEAPITVSGAADATNPTRYYFIYDDGTLTVNPAPVTVTGTTVTTRAYNGTTNATLANGMLSGVFSQDTGNVTLVQSGTFASKDANTNIPVTATDTLSGSAAGDYSLTEPTGLTGTITPLALTVTGSSVTSRVYNGTTNATLTGGVLNGVVSADLSYVSLTSQSGTFASKNANTNIPVTANDTLSVTGGATGDYTLTEPTGLTGTITPLAVTVTGSSVTQKVYDGTTNATLTGGVLNGVLTNDQAYVSLTSQSGTFASKNANTNIPVTANDTLLATGEAMGDYTLTQPTGLTGTITPLAVTVTGSSVTQKVYDGTTNATLTGGVLNGVLSGDQPYVSLTSQLGTFASKDANTNIPVTANDTLSATGEAMGDYTLTQPTGLAGTITPLAVTVAGTSVAQKVYDGTTNATLTGGVLNGVLSADQPYVSLTSQSGTFASKNANTNIPVTANDTLSATGGATGDYTLTQPTGLTGTITPLAVTVTGSSVTQKVYDGTTAASLTGGVLNGVLSADQPYVSLSSQSGTFVSKNAGTAVAVTATDTLSATGTATGDYTLTEPAGLTGTITPLAVTVTGTSVTPKVYDGTTAATLTGGSLSGVFTADSNSVTLMQSGTFSSKNVGSGIGVTATDTLSGVAAGDYTLTEPTGLTGTITPLALTVTGSSVTPKVYDGTTAAALTGGVLSGVISADQPLVSLVQSGTFASKNAGSGIGVTATDTLSATGAAAGDYTLTEPTGLTGTITRRPVTLGSGETAESKTYDGTTAATLSATPLNNVLPGDSGGVSLVGTFASPNAGQDIAVTAALSGADAGNYVLSGAPKLAANINPAPLLATANPVTSPEGAVPPALSGTFSGFVDGQTLLALEAEGYRASWTSNASDDSAVGHYGITGAFTDGNYAVVQAAANASAYDVSLASSNGITAGTVLATLTSVPATSGGGSFSGSGSGGNSLSASAAGSVGGSLATSGSGSGNGAGNGGDASSTQGLASGSAGGGNGGVSSAPGVAGSSGGNADGGGASGGGASTGLSLGADTTITASDGTVTLSATQSDSGAIAASAKASLLDFGGRRLIVIDGGVNARAAH